MPLGLRWLCILDCHTVKHGSLSWKTAPLKIKMGCIMTGDLWCQVQFCWNLGPVGNVWPFKTGGYSQQCSFKTIKCYCTHAVTLTKLHCWSCHYLRFHFWQIKILPMGHSPWAYPFDVKCNLEPHENFSSSIAFWKLQCLSIRVFGLILVHCYL